MVGAGNGGEQNASRRPPANSTEYRSSGPAKTFKCSLHLNGSRPITKCFARPAYWLLLTLEEFRDCPYSFVRQTLRASSFESERVIADAHRLRRALARWCFEELAIIRPQVIVMEDSVSIAETKDNSETKEKVSIVVVKEKVSNAAAKGGKAFMSLVHMAKHPSKESKSKPNGSPNGMDGDSDESSLDSPNSSTERKTKHVFDEQAPDSLNSPKSSMERKAKLVNKLKHSFKGKKSTDADDRSQLLDGNLDDLSPRVRSANSIKIAYGHKPSTDPTSIAAMTREKLIERQEKIQDMNKQSEEMLEGAADFASIADELAKKIENKKWYQL